MGAGSYPQLSGQLFKSGPGRAIANDDQVELPVKLRHGFEEQHVVLHRRQPSHDADHECSIGKAPASPLCDTHRLVDCLERIFRQKVGNLDDLSTRHPFLASKKFGHRAAVRQDSMGQPGGPAIDRHQLRTRRFVPPAPARNNRASTQHARPWHGEDIAVDVV